jgi:hypothetical protein
MLGDDQVPAGLPVRLMVNEGTVGEHGWAFAIVNISTHINVKSLMMIFGEGTVLIFFF